MNVDFSLVMVVLVAISGGIWALDTLVFAPARRKKLAAVKPGGNTQTRLNIEKPPVLVEYARSFFPIFLIVLLLRSFLVEPFRIPSGSMMPTLLIGDFILVNKFGYGIRLPVLNTKVIEIAAPKRGDIAVFRYPEDPSVPFIKRIVGLPGDRISYNDKTLYVNGAAIAQDEDGIYTGAGGGSMMTGASLRTEHLPGAEHDILVIPRRRSQVVQETVVPDGHYFALGDNRDNSKDSRYWGYVPDENLIGKAFMIWMNWDDGIDWNRLGNKIY